MSEAKYRYEIHPRIPMRNVLDKAIIKPTTVELTLDQVKECLKYGPVYRRFNADHIEKVTLFNIDALHAEKYNPSAIKNEVVKEEPKKPSIKFKEESKPIVDEKADEKIEGQPTPVIEDKAEEVKEEASVEESAPEEVKEASTEEKADEKAEETVSEAPAEEAVEEEKVAESSEEENVTEVTEEEDDDVKAPVSNNGGKKKKHH